MRFAALVALLAVSLPVAACAEGIPQAALDRCETGAGDDNDTYTVRQGPACRIVAVKLQSNGQKGAALNFARKACELQDADGCELYLTLVHREPAEVLRARNTGEKACNGMVVSKSGEDPRLRICYVTAELYEEVAPRSPDDAARLYARACKLGHQRACDHASGAGQAAADQAAAAATTPALPPPVPLPTSQVVTQVVTPACHEMRECVQLDIHQRNGRSVEGTLTNRCDHTASCRWCAARGAEVDHSQCRSGVIKPGESRVGTQWGLWFDGYNAMAYDCIEEHDAPGCLSL